MPCGAGSAGDRGRHREHRICYSQRADGPYARHPDQPAGRLLRRLRPHAAARRAGRAVPGRRRAPPGLRAVHRARPARGLDPRVRRRRADACAARATRAAAGWSTGCARAASARARSPTPRPRRRRRSPAGTSTAAAPARADARAGAARAAAARPRHVRAVPTNAELKMERALDVFNASDHVRTVGGVARSLGAAGRLASARWPTGPASSRSPSCGS